MLWWRPWFRSRQLVRRGEGAAALAGAGDAPGPELLSRLGLHLSVLELKLANSPRGDLARAIAFASLGDVTQASAIAASIRGELSVGDRLRLAGAMAPWSPAVALQWLPENAGAKADAAKMACLLAANDIAAARGISPRLSGNDVETHALRAMLESLAGHSAAVRRAINAMFEAQGWQGPLDTGETLPTLDTFGPADPASDIPIAAGPSLVSVVMPARDAAATIGTAIRSVLAQSHKALELIVVDDASTDATLEAARTAIAGDPRASILAQPAMRGAYLARNRGLAAAAGEFIAFNDADDWSHPERLARAVALLRETRATALVSNLIRIDETGRVVAPRVFPLVRLNTSSLMFRREPVLGRLGGFEPVQIGGDAEYLARIAAVFGPDVVLRDRNVSMVVLLRRGSLAWHSPTGIDRPEAVRARIAYRESWMRQQADFLRHGGDLRSPL